MSYQKHFWLIDGEEEFSEFCQVDDEFSNTNYKASPDGVYQFKLLNDESTLDFSKVAKMRVELSGSYIPFPSKKLPALVNYI